MKQMMLPGWACAMPTKKYPRGRTGMRAGHDAHIRAGEPACEPCKTAATAKTMVYRRDVDPDDYAEYRRRLSEHKQALGRGEKIPACEKPTFKYPQGRTGTNAGWHAHRTANEAACEACIKGASASSSARWVNLPPEKRKELKQADYRRNYDTRAAANYRAKHGMTFEEYDDLLESQGGGCAICGSVDPGGRWQSTGRFHLDHDHACCPSQRSCAKCQRGLLCARCNVGLGAFGDDIDKLTAAVAYLLTRVNVLEVAND